MLLWSQQVLRSNTLPISERWLPKEQKPQKRCTEIQKENICHKRFIMGLRKVVPLVRTWNEFVFPTRPVLRAIIEAQKEIKYIKKNVKMHVDQKKCRTNALSMSFYFALFASFLCRVVVRGLRRTAVCIRPTPTQNWIAHRCYYQSDLVKMFSIVT